MHLFGHTLDHDYYFELPREGERDTQSISRCSVRLLSPGPWLVGTTKVSSGVGADIVMESISPTTPAILS